MSDSDWTEIELKELMSGDDEGVLWVTLGYVSGQNPNDVLHIVVSKETTNQDWESGGDTVYLEGFDQSLSSNRGADRIFVDAEHIEISLNRVGVDALQLPPALRFKRSGKLPGSSDALARFREMAARGPVVVVKPSE